MNMDTIWKELCQVRRTHNYLGHNALDFVRGKNKLRVYSLTPEQISELIAQGHPAILAFRNIVARARLLGIEVQGWP